MFYNLVGSLRGLPAYFHEGGQAVGYNTKNYTEQNGDKTVIGGELEILAEGSLNFNGKTLKPAALQANSTAVDAAGLVTDFNGLLGKLKAAGLMESK